MPLFCIFLCLDPEQNGVAPGSHPEAGYSEDLAQEEGTHVEGLWSGDRTLRNGHGNLALTFPVALAWPSFGI